MKFTILCTLIVSVCSSSFAQNVADKFAELKSKRDQAVAVAVAPIDQKFHALLTDLLPQATKAGDFKTAQEITELLAKAQTEAKAASKASPAGPTRLAKKDIDGLWTLTTLTGFRDIKTLKRDGTIESHGQDTPVKGPGKPNGKWVVTGNMLHMDYGGGNHDRFELLLQDGKLTGVTAVGQVVMLQREK